MFLKNSRYFNTPKVTISDRSGKKIRAIKIRPLPNTSDYELEVKDGYHLDVLSEELFKDATRFWHIADANCELEANELVRVTARKIKIPEV